MHLTKIYICSGVHITLQVLCGYSKDTIDEHLKYGPSCLQSDTILLQCEDFKSASQIKRYISSIVGKYNILSIGTIAKPTLFIMSANGCGHACESHTLNLSDFKIDLLYELQINPIGFYRQTSIYQRDSANGFSL